MMAEREGQQQVFCKLPAKQDVSIVRGLWILVRMDVPEKHAVDRFDSHLRVFLATLAIVQRIGQNSTTPTVGRMSSGHL